ncbi:MAG TPA: DUF4147 domain-containing protein, partial [Candidatus Acidoferrales bacterium]|nr:DUF4147 domain-containing protein [Candidatus Acidoferrales bacterium]
MNDLKQVARKIFAETLAGIDIPATLCRKLARAGTRITVAEQEIDLAAYKSIVAIAIGKAGFAMASGLCDLLAPEFSASGILAVPTAPPRELPGFRAFLAGHPVPNAASLEAGRAALELLTGCDERTLVFVLLSGGGSALCEFPLDASNSLEDVRQLNRVLVTCG